MKRRRSNSGVYQYLESLGLLTSGSDEQIAIAKRTYWKQYKYDWLKNKRKNKALTVYLNDTEYGIINAQAKKHRRSNTRFIKEATLAYVRQRYLVLDSTAVNEIKGRLTQIHVLFKAMASDKRLSYREVEKQLQVIMTLEMQLISQLTNPKKVSDDR